MTIAETRSVEIRCVVDRVDQWEIVSTRRCCVFAWERTKNGASTYFDPRSHCDRCIAELQRYAADRGYAVQRRSGVTR